MKRKMKGKTLKRKKISQKIRNQRREANRKSKLINRKRNEEHKKKKTEKNTFVRNVNQSSQTRRN